MLIDAIPVLEAKVVRPHVTSPSELKTDHPPAGGKVVLSNPMVAGNGSVCKIEKVTEMVSLASL